MTTSIALRHRTEYRYDRHVTLGPQVVRLRPAPHTRVPIERYGLRVEPAEHFCNWQQDPHGNWLARLVFPKPTDRLVIEVDVAAELVTVNPFDFFLEPHAENVPFAYGESLEKQLAPYLRCTASGPRFEALLAEIPREPAQTVAFLVELNQKLQQRIAYVTRMEPGVKTPEETLTDGNGSCRDTALLFVQLLRRLGIASRFVSGYLVQLVADRKPVDGPEGPTSDFTDLHAWTEAYLPGAGWVGLDPTSGLFAGEGHIPLAATPEPEDAAPVTGGFAFAKEDDDDECEVEFHFEMHLERIRESPPIARDYSRDEWSAIDALGAQIDASIRAAGLSLTMGGEPTFISETDLDGDEWNLTALGPTKRAKAGALAERLLDAFGRGGLIHVGQGKWYPGESLPRWAITVGWRADGVPLWNDAKLLADENEGTEHGLEEAHRFAVELANALGVGADFLRPAYEDPFYYAWRESRLPVDVDPFDSKLDDAEERARLLRVFSRGLGTAVGWVLPLSVDEGVFRSGPWVVRDAKLKLIPGDSAMGFRLPIDSLPYLPPDQRVVHRTHDPMIVPPELPNAQALRVRREQRRGERLPPADASKVRTALCVEPREGMVHVFLPPLSSFDEFVLLVSAIEATANSLALPVRLEGYLPPSDPRFRMLQITPDPGVIEVNVHPAASFAELSTITRTVYAEAKQVRLGAEKFLIDGRHVGTGGGHHLVLGGPTPSESPFLRRPELLASFTAYFQCHPSLSYLFSGMFVGPTSQHPRIDEARTESRWELETAIAHTPVGETQMPWLVDRLFRNVLIDVTGNTHRTEISIDKLYSPDGPTGRRGLVELRAFEMQPHPAMSLSMQLLVRALFARFVAEPFRGPLARWSTELHDRFLLPHFVWSDFVDVLDDLREHGFALDPRWYERHLEHRFPIYGRVRERDVSMELRMALEPWHVMGEEAGAAGTVRYVDSSVERLQVRLEGATPGRHAVLCNGRFVPLHETGTPGSLVAGVRFRAWQPSSCLHPTIPVQAPLVFELVDLHRGRAVKGCTYHVGHPGGRNYDSRPVNAVEAEARRAARFEEHGVSGSDREAIGRFAEPRTRDELPYTLDLIRT